MPPEVHHATLKCTLHTGRTHQIRMHMKHLGHPLLGDELYARLSRQTRTGRLMLQPTGWDSPTRQPANA